jgi:hypothetical protein
MAANASGKRKALGTSEHRVAKKAIQRIWGEHDKGFRVFLSHRSKSKKKAADLKERLALFGVSCFVAHQDVSPTKAWQDEIELALHSMDAFVALMTKGFHDSLWTDQEVGFAFARAVPIVTLRLGADPYGFIGKFQALSCSLEAAPARIAGLLINQPGMLDFYIDAVARCRNWDEGNVLASVLPHIDKLTHHQAQKFVSAFKNNGEVSGCFGFNGSRAREHGDGLAIHLKRATGRRYKLSP